MELKIFEDYKGLSEYAANEMLELIKRKPAAVICMASGDSPGLACELFCQKVKDTNTDASQFFFVGLDEWVGLPSAMYGSCHNDFTKRLIEPLALPQHNIICLMQSLLIWKRNVQ